MTPPIARLLRLAAAVVLLSSRALAEPREPEPYLLTFKGEPPEAAAPPMQLFHELGNLHLAQSGVLDLQLGWRTRSWEIGVILENLANLEGWDVQRDERSLFAAPAGRDALPAEDVVAAPNNPWNVRLFVTLWF